MHEVSLLGLIHGRPDEAAEVWMQFAPLPPDEYDRPVPLEVYRGFVARVLSGMRYCMLQVEDQKALNALAGYFWVEPRRLPPDEPLCDLCNKPVTDGSKDVVSGRPRHPDCIPY